LHLGDPGGDDRRVGPAVEGGTVAGFVGVVRPGRGGEQRASIPITP
jgi:hypothetical protein